MTPTTAPRMQTRIKVEGEIGGTAVSDLSIVKSSTRYKAWEKCWQSFVLIFYEVLNRMVTSMCRFESIQLFVNTVVKEYH